MAKLPEKRLLFINNEWVPSVSGKTYETVNPTTGEVICSVAQACAEDVEVAVQAAKKAFESWGSLDGAERAKYLFKMAAEIEKRAVEIATLESTDNGMHIMVAKGETVSAVKTLYYYAGFGDKLEGRTIPYPGHHVYTIHEPYGVCAGILPWNFPFVLTFAKLAPALIAGNTMIIKPSEKTPLTALIVAEIVEAVGLPAGVVNVLTGFGDVGAALASSMEVDKVSFTGSVVTGKKIMEAAARSNLKKVTLELGGKSPLIVFPDANLDVAAEIAHHGIFTHQGQICVASSRIFVHESIYDEFIKKSVEKAKNRKIGNPLEPTTGTGPIVDQLQFDRVLSYIEAGRQEGATLAVGGNKHGDKGFFIEPTIFTDVTCDMKIAREEIFGPVMSVFKFKDEEEVIRKANDTTYGLAASVVTKNISTAHRVASKIRAGTLWINTHGTFPLRAPFGGYKQSGIGLEFGEEGLREYQLTKTVVANLSVL